MPTVLAHLFIGNLVRTGASDSGEVGHPIDTYVAGVQRVTTQFKFVDELSTPRRHGACMARHRFSRFGNRGCFSDPSTIGLARHFVTTR